MKAIKIILLGLIIPLQMTFAGNDNDLKKGEKMNQVVTFTGKVIDQITGESLTGVKIVIPGTTSISYTDFNGNFSIKNVQPGEYEIETSLISYYSKKIKVKIDVEKEIEIELKTIN